MILHFGFYIQLVSPYLVKNLIILLNFYEEAEERKKSSYLYDANIGCLISIGAFSQKYNETAYIDLIQMRYGREER